MRPRASELIDELHRAFDGQPWHGPSILELLRPVSPADAEARPIADAHTIGEITAHLTAWTNEVTRRLEGLPPGDPPEGDWPPSLAATPAGWASMTLSLAKAIAQLEAVIVGFPAGRWDVPINDPRRPSGADAVTFAQMVHGLAQHLAYHGGQIALLRKAVAGRLSAS